MKSITVFCGSKPGHSDSFSTLARSLGKTLAKRDIQIVYGGAKIGLMGEIADSALRNGGKVVGVLPDFLRNREILHTGLTETHIVSSMHERKALMNELCDGVIALPGGLGTLDEVFEMLTWAQLGLHGKPIGFLNINGYYDLLIKFIDQMISEEFMKDLNKDLFVVDSDIEGLLQKMEDFKGPPVRQWLNSDQV